RVIKEGSADRTLVKAVIVCLLREPWVDGLDCSGAHRQQLQPRGTFDEKRHDRGFFDRRAGAELAVVCQEDRALVADRLGNYPALLVTDWRTWPFRQPGAIIME